MSNSEFNIRSELGLSDLRLLMDNYRNIMQMNAVLLEQQKHVLELIQQLVNKQDSLSTQALKADLHRDKIIEKLSDISKIHEIVKESHEKTSSMIMSKLDKAEDEAQNYSIKNTQEYHDITNKIYWAMGITAAAIVPLISLVIIVYNKYEIVGHIHDMLQQLLLYFNIK